MDPKNFDSSLSESFEKGGSETLDSEIPPQGAEFKPSVDASKTRVFSAQRMKYSAEVGLIRSRHGDLEDMRKTLGLSQRKMAQLLLVDPSAWTRWIKQSDAPPHIYRSLSWFLTLQEKDPSQSPYNWLQTVARPTIPQSEIQMIRRQLETELKTLIYKKVALWVGLSALISVTIAIIARTV